MHTHFDDEVEKYPTTSPGEALAVTVIALFIGWAVIEVIDYVLEEGLINWVAGWF